MNEEPNGLEPPWPEPEPEPERQRDHADADDDADNREAFEALVHPDTDPPAEPPPLETVEPPSESLALDTSMTEAFQPAETPGADPGAAWDSSTSAPAPTPPAAADPSAAVLETLGRLSTVLAKRLDALQAAFEREARAEASREKIVDRLHEELQEYKQDLWFKVMKPVFMDLIQLHDDMGKMADSLEDNKAASLLLDFQAGVEDILYRQGVEPFRVEEEHFDPRRQRAVSSVPCDDPDQAKTIAARHRPGFAIEDRAIRPELVSVYVERKA